MPPHPPRFNHHLDHARAITAAVLHAADPAAAVDRAWPGIEPPTGRLVLLAVGKAALAMASAAAERLPRVDQALVIAPKAIAASSDARASAFDILPADHPLPTERNIEAATRVRDLARSLSADDLLLFCLSGGGSAYLAIPADELTLDDLAAVTSDLNRAGATIRELNTVRKHCERLKGGRLAALAHPARLLALILSDVIGDPLHTIASGPVSPDPTTYAHALDVLQRHNLAHLHPAITRHLQRGARGELDETPKEHAPCFASVQTHVVANHETALRAAASAAERLGFDVARTTSHVTGDAAAVAHTLITDAARTFRPLDRPAAWSIAGETTVDASVSSGAGGPAQELALAAAIALESHPRTALLSLATDGVDGPTDAAGAIVTCDTAPRLRSIGIDPARALAEHDSHTALHRAGALLRTGPTGTNLNDLAVLLAYDR